MKLRDLANTAFSIERLFIWTIGIIAIIGMVGMIVIGYQGKEIPPQVQSATMFCLGVAASSLKDWIKK